MTDATPATQPTGRLETETCSRCGGSGSYSYCQRYGSTCFKCAGRRVVYTKRGLAASRYLTEIRSKPAGELAAADRIQYEAITMSGEAYAAWYEVESVGPCDSRARSFVNGVEVPVRADLLKIELKSVKAGRDGLTLLGVNPDKLIRVAQTAEQKAETLARAIAYQATLTKAGTPRKR